MKYVVKTLGCKANLADSQRLEAELRARGWTAASGREDQAGVCIVNSCTVTDEADRQSRKLAARLKRDNPGARIVMTGCAAEVDPQGLAGRDGVDVVVGNQDKSRLVSLVLEAGERASGVLGGVTGYREMASRHPMDREWPEPEESFGGESVEGAEVRDRTRAFLTIQEGCGAFCTYCVIPYGRGPSRSLGIAPLVSRVRELVSRGVREVVLTGTNIGDYGSDWGGGTPRLEELVERLLGETRLERLRVSSLDPVEITPRLIRLMESDPRFCRHFHVSLQSPHPRILKLMKRKYGHEEARDSLLRIAETGAFVGMDVITGFPGETRREFEWGVEALRALPWSRLHVFPYSERKGTPATRLPGSVSRPERALRAEELRALSFDRLGAVYRAASGKVLNDVLLERPIRGPDGTRRWVAGYSPGYLRAVIRMDEGLDLERNQLVSVATDGKLWSDPASGDVSFLGTLVTGS